MSESLKLAAEWAKLNAPQGAQASSGTAPRDAGDPKAKSNEQQDADTQASVKRIAEVAQAARAAVAARRGGPGVAQAAAPAKTPTRDIVREGRELDNASKKRKVQTDKLSTIMTENTIKDDAMLEVLGEVFADDADGKRFATFQALKPMQKQAQLTRWKAIWLEQRKKEQANGQ